MFLRHVVGLSKEEIDDLTDWEIENYPQRWFATKTEVMAIFISLFMGEEKTKEIKEKGLMTEKQADNLIKTFNKLSGAKEWKVKREAHSMPS